MTLRDQFLQDLQKAMRAQDVARRDTLRLLRAALGNAEIEAGHTLSEKEEIEIVTREAKRRREAIDEYTPLGRIDKVEEARIELAIIESYLPQQMTRQEIESLARQVIEEVGINGPSASGEVMRRLMPQIKGRADGRLASEIVRELLSVG